MSDNRPKIERRRFPVLGMMCTVCSGTVQSALLASKGVVGAEVSFADQSALVSWNTEETSPAQLAATVKEAGYELIHTSDEAEALREQDRREDERYRHQKRLVTLAWTLTLPVAAICMTHAVHSTAVDWTVGALTLVVMAVCGARFYTTGFRNLLRGHASMESLVAVSTSVSFLLSLFTLIWPGYWRSHGLDAALYFEGAAMIIAFVLTGKLLEMRARHSAGAALRGLMALQPDVALKKLPDGTTKLVRTADLRPGDTALARPGERIVADGVVTGGDARVNESMLTGEPMPVHKVPGDVVHAGTTMESGSLDIQVTHTGDTTVLGGIIERVREAQASKAPVQKLVDRISAVFVPAVMTLAVATFIIWYICSPGNLAMAVLASVSVLVISCPCALGLATPTAITVGMGRGAAAGILFRDAAALEKLSRIRTLCIDKTGTLTEGNPSVTDTFFSDISAAAAATVTASLESHSEHPLARALAHWAEENGASASRLSDFRQLPGKGVEGMVNDKPYWLGSVNMARERGVRFTGAAETFLTGRQQEGAGIVALGSADTLMALFAIADTVRPEAAQTITGLHKLGIKTILLTGDAEAPAKHIARLTGIMTVKASMSPLGKADMIDELHRRRQRVAMVGDGVNDAPALAKADVAVALSSGTDIAMDVAGLTLVGGGLGRLTEAVVLSEKTREVIRQNLFWAFIYNIIGIPLAAGILYPGWGILLNPMMASAAMALSSVCVVTNSLRLRKVRLTGK